MLLLQNVGVVEPFPNVKGKDIIGGKVKKSAMAASISKKFFPNVKVSLLSEEEED